MSAKDLQFRAKQIGERLSESVHILDHDPSMALYRLQEHITKTMPVLVNRKYQTLNLNAKLQGACFDLDNDIQTVEQIKTTLPAFERIHEKLRNCMYYKQQIDYEISRASIHQNTSSSTPVAAPVAPSPVTQPDSDRTLMPASTQGK